MAELDKMAQAKPRSQAIGEFLEWLREKGIVLAEYHKHSKDECGSVRWPECGICSEQPVAHHYNTETLLAEFFEIDLNRVEDEKRAILEELRAEHESTDQA